MKQEFDYIVFIGRFQPYHIEHHNTVKHALSLSKNVIIVLGSHEKAPDIRNPLSTHERASIISSAFYADEEVRHRWPDVHFIYQHDYPYQNERWITSVQSAVNAITLKTFQAGPVKIGIIGFSKDHTSFYLKTFPQWETVEYIPTDLRVNATNIRRHIFERRNPDEANIYLVSGTEDGVHYYFDRRPELFEEWNVIQKYKNSWANVPYPVTFNTVDAVVTQSGHILLVQRGAHPGKGQWALPGGFLNPTETLEQAVLRELYEETKIDVPKPVIRGSIASVRTFDDPDRSVRGRTITTAFHVKLNDMNALPKIKGSDDAVKAKWFSFSDFYKMRDKMFEDHFHICQLMIGI